MGSQNTSSSLLSWMPSYLNNGLTATQNWYQEMKETVWDAMSETEESFFMTLHKDVDYMEFKGWRRSIKNEIKALNQAILSGEMNAVELGQRLLAFQTPKQMKEEAYSPVMYAWALTQLEKSFRKKARKNKATNVTSEELILSADTIHHVLKQLRRELYENTELADENFDRDFYNAVLMYVGDNPLKKGLSKEGLMTILDYYKNLIDDDLRESFVNYINTLPEYFDDYHSSSSVSRTNRNIKRLLQNVQDIFENYESEAEIKTEVETELDTNQTSRFQRFGVLLETAFELTEDVAQQGIQYVRENPTTVVKATVIAAAALSYGYSFSVKDNSSNSLSDNIFKFHENFSYSSWDNFVPDVFQMSQASQIFFDVSAICGLSILSGHQELGAPGAFIASFARLWDGTQAVAPTVVNPIPDQFVDVGVPFDYSLSWKSIFNVSKNTTLSLKATLSNGNPLPVWLNFEIEPYAISNYSATGASDVKLYDEILFVTRDAGAFSGLLVLNATNRSNLIYLNQYISPSSCYGVDIINNTLALAAMESGLIMFDVSNLPTLELKSSYNTTGAVRRVNFIGGFLCTSDIGAGLVNFYNYSDLSSLSHLGAVNTSGTAYESAYLPVEDQLVVSDGDFGAQLYRVNNFSQSQHLDGYDTPEYAGALCFDYIRKVAFVIDETSIFAFNVTNDSLQYLYDYYFGGRSYACDLKGYTLFIVNNNFGLHVFDVRNLNNATLLKIFNIFNLPAGLDVFGHLVVVGDYNFGAHLIGIDRWRFFGTPLSRGIYTIDLTACDEQFQCETDQFSINVGNVTTTTTTTTTTSTTTQSQTEIQPVPSAYFKTIGGNGTDIGFSLQITSSGETLAVGMTNSFGSEFVSFVERYSEGGDLTRFKTFSAGGFNFAANINLMPDGSYYITGGTDNGGIGGRDGFINKFFQNDTIDWSNVYGGLLDDALGALDRMSNGDLWMVFVGKSYGAGDVDSQIVKMNSAGIPISAKNFGSEGTEELFTVEKTSDGGAYYGGYSTSTSYGVQNADAVLLRVNQDGELDWGKLFGASEWDAVKSLRVNSNNDVLITGHLGNAGNRTGYVAQFFSNGTLAWANQFTHVEDVFFHHMKVTPNNEILLLGGLGSFSNHSLILARTHETNGLISVKKIAHIGVWASDFCFDLEVDSLGAPRIFGYTDYYNAVNSDLMLSQLDFEDDILGCSENEDITSSFGYGPFDLNVRSFFPVLVNITLSWQAWNPVIVDRILSEQTICEYFPTTTSTTTQSQTEIQPVPSAYFKTIGGVSDDVGKFIRLTNDGGSFVTGTTDSYGAGLVDVFLQRFSKDGTLLWTKTFGGIGHEESWSLQLTSLGEPVILGLTDSSGVGGADGFLLRCSTNGAVIWAKTFGGIGTEFAYDLQVTTNGKIFVSGRTTSSGAGNNDVFLAEFSEADGSLVWAKTLGGSGDDVARGLHLTADDHLLQIGHTSSYGVGDSDVLLTRFFNNGTLDWANMYGGEFEDIGMALKVMPDGGCVLTGWTESYGAGTHDFLLVRVAENGSLIWATALGGLIGDHSYFVDTLANGDILVMGGSRSFDLGEFAVLYARFNSSGDLIWAKTLGGELDDFGYSFQPTADGGFISTGRTANYGIGGLDTLIAKFDSNGNIPGCPAIRDVTANLTVTSFSPIVTPIIPTVQSFALTVQDWPIQAVDQSPTVQTHCEHFPTTSSTSSSSSSSSKSTLPSGSQNSIVTSSSSFFKSSTDLPPTSSNIFQTTSDLSQALTSSQQQQSSNTGMGSSSSSFVLSSGDGLPILYIVLISAGIGLAVLVCAVGGCITYKIVTHSAADEEQEVDLGFDLDEHDTSRMSTLPRRINSTYGPTSEVRANSESQYCMTPTTFSTMAKVSDEEGSGESEGEQITYASLANFVEDPNQVQDCNKRPGANF